MELSVAGSVAGVLHEEEIVFLSMAKGPEEPEGRQGVLRVCRERA